MRLILRIKIDVFVGCFNIKNSWKFSIQFAVFIPLISKINMERYNS